MVPLCSLTIRAKSISNDSIFIKFLNIRRTISLFTTQTSDFFQNISTISPVHPPICGYLPHAPATFGPTGRVSNQNSA